MRSQSSYNFYSIRGHVPNVYSYMDVMVQTSFTIQLMTIVISTQIQYIYVPWKFLAYTE